jgi:hypothetical protein
LLQTLSLRPERRPASARAFAIALASATPEEPPYHPSGAEILAMVARELVTHAPSDETTVKNHASADRVAPMLWGAARSDGDNVPAPSHTAAAEGVAVPAPTVVARPAAPLRDDGAPAGGITTLSAVAGSPLLPALTLAPLPSRRKRWLGGGSVALLGLVVAAAWLLRERPGEPSLAASKDGSSAARESAGSGAASARVPRPALPADDIDDGI